MSRSLSLSFAVDELIVRAERKRDKIIVEHERAVKKYEEALSKAREKLRAGLVKEARRTKVGEVLRYANSLRVTVQVPLPSRPTEKPNTDRIDAHLRMLRGTSQTTIRISESSPLAYLLEG